MDIRATNRLGKATIYKASTTVIKAKNQEPTIRTCEQCSEPIEVESLYVQFTAIKRFDSSKRPGTQYVGFFLNTHVHVECLTPFVTENYARMKARATPKKKKGEKYEGAGRPLLPLEDEVRADRLKIMKYMSVYRLQLKKAFREDHMVITRLKKKLGYYITELYDPEKPYNVGVGKREPMDNEIITLLYKTDTRWDIASQYSARDFLKLGKLLAESEVKHMTWNRWPEICEEFGITMPERESNDN